MSEKLYKLGKWAFAHRWRVFAVWAIVFVVFGTLAASFKEPYSSKISIPGTEATATLDRLSKELPAASKGNGTIVFAADKGHTVMEQRSNIDAVLGKVTKTKGVASAMSPFVAQTISKDGRIAFATIQFKTDGQEISTETKDAIATIAETSNTAGLQVEIRGDMVQAVPDAGSTTEAIGVAIAAVVLVITFGSLVAAGMPILIAMIAVGLGTLGVTTASGFLTLSSTTPVLAVMLGLAVGIDYSLFLIVRYVKYLREGTDPREAAGRMVATAGNAVIFAALTVVIALSALSVVGVPFLAAMGVFAALTVAIAAIAAITLVPALLSFARFKVVNKTDRLQIKQHGRADEASLSRRTLGHRWVSLVVKRPIIVLIVTIIGLGALALPATKLYLGLPDDSAAAQQSTQRKAYDLLSEGFGPGFNGPLLVVATLPNNLSKAEQQTKLAVIANNLQKDDGITAAVPAGVNADGTTGILQAYPTTGPGEKATRELIARIRDNAAGIAGSNTTLALTGATAVAVDVDDKLAAALPLYLLVVVGLSLLVLLAVFRSIVVPIKATAGFILTIFATLGTIVMFFQWGWLGLIEPGPVLSFLPILATGILFGLAMDYQFFLVSGMHEEYAHDKNKNAKRAVVEGFSHGAKVVTAAAIIMISVFSGFIFTSDTTIRSIGFALAVGVLIDAFIVRMTIVPAVMVLFGKTAWWLPKWLAKIVPNLSIEGDESIFLKDKR